MNIKKAADLFDLSPDTLRYYEKTGIVPPVHRAASGFRDYQTRDLNWIYLVRSLRRAGMGIDAFRQFTQLAKKRESNNGSSLKQVDAAQKAILQNQLIELDEKIAELQQTRKILAYKIATYKITSANSRTVNGMQKIKKSYGNANFLALTIFQRMLANWPQFL